MKQQTFDLNTVLALAEQREALNTKLKTFSPPVVLIKDNDNQPVYKITVTMVGDLFIYINQNNNSILGMLSKISKPEELLSDPYEMPMSHGNEVVSSYIKAMRLTKSSKKGLTGSISRNPSDLLDINAEEEHELVEALGRTSGRIGRGDTYGSEKSKVIPWKLVVAIPIADMLEISEFLGKIFGDDIYINEESSGASSSNS